MAIDREEFKIEPDEDDGMSALALQTHLEEETKRKQKLLKSEFEEMGERYLKEIDRKKKHHTQKSTKLFPYIIKHSDGKYDEEELLSYSHEDVQDIYNEIKASRRPVIIKIIRFVFNL